MGFRFFILTLALLIFHSSTLAQTQLPHQKEILYAVVKDMHGDKVEKYFHFYPGEVKESTKDHQGKSLLLKYIECIKLEKIYSGIPGAEQVTGEGYYSIGFQNSQEIFSSRKNYTFSLNTSLGLVAKTIDAKLVQDFFRKDYSPIARSKEEQPFIRDKSVIFSLELKF